MRKPGSGWYHSACDSAEAEVLYFKEDPTSFSQNWFGPFGSFSAAKKDALDYYRGDLEKARYSVQLLRAKKAPLKKD